MGDNIPASVFNVLVLAFFVVVALGVVLGAYAAIQLRKCQEKLRQYEAGTTTPVAKPAATNAEPEA